MPVFDRLRSRLRLLVRSERGMALPTALFAVIVGLGLASAAVFSSVDAQRGTKRDGDSKSAIAAADAGAGVALLRLNRFQTDLTAAQLCVGPNGEPQTPSGGWCPATAPESVGSAQFSYWVSAFQEDTPLSVVAVGTAGTVSRRIEVGLVSYNGDPVFADEKLIGQDGIDMEGTPDIYTDIGTNGDITSDGSGTLCGNVRHGIGRSAPQPDCDGEVTEGNKDLPPVVPPEDIATNNSNCRLDVTCLDSNGNPDPTQADTYTKRRTSTTPWDPATRTINVSENAALTLGGGDYWVCALVVQNGQLIMADGANVRIFFDTPENCGLSAGDAQVSITGNANIVSTGYNPSEGSYAVPGLYLLGSPACAEPDNPDCIPTTVTLTGNSGTNELVLYAPYSDIEIGGNATWIGMVAGRSLYLHGNPMIASDPNIAPPDNAYSSLWERTGYVECVGAAATPPDANC